MSRPPSPEIPQPEEDVYQPLRRARGKEAVNRSSSPLIPTKLDESKLVPAKSVVSTPPDMAWMLQQALENARALHPSATISVVIAKRTPVFSAATIFAPREPEYVAAVVDRNVQRYVPVPGTTALQAQGRVLLRAMRIAPSTEKALEFLHEELMGLVGVGIGFRFG